MWTFNYYRAGRASSRIRCEDGSRDLRGRERVFIFISISFFYLFFPRQVQKKKHGSCLRAGGVVRAWEGFSIFDPFGWGDFLFFFFYREVEMKNSAGEASKAKQHGIIIILHSSFVIIIML